MWTIGQENPNYLQEDTELNNNLNKKLNLPVSKDIRRYTYNATGKISIDLADNIHKKFLS